MKLATRLIMVQWRHSICRSLQPQLGDGGQMVLLVRAGGLALYDELAAAERTVFRIASAPRPVARPPAAAGECGPARNGRKGCLARGRQAAALGSEHRHVEVLRWLCTARSPT